MNIFIMADMEGISGICLNSQVTSTGENYQSSRRYMTWDVNACVEGCFAGGAQKVVVRDVHCSGYNLIWEELDARAQYIQGASFKERMPDIGSFDGLILLGYHAMAGTPQGILEHTMSSRSWQNFWINGRKAGELAIDAGIAADHGVPTIMASGDDKLCLEARRFLKDIVTVQVKKGLDIEGGELLSKANAHQLIREGATRAVQNCKKIKPVKIKSPVKLRLELVSRGRVPARSDVRIIDGRTYEVTGKTVEQALRSL
jgi:D-amino peptidase